jgi:hypothetical protein
VATVVNGENAERHWRLELLAKFQLPLFVVVNGENAERHWSQN